MARIGSQNRLLIPNDLTTLIKLEQGKIGVFWDDEQKRLFLDKLENAENQDCIAIRTLDNKNRICLSKDILQLIGADYSSEMAIVLRNKRIYLFKV